MEYNTVHLPSEFGQTHWRFICSDLHIESPECMLSKFQEDADVARKVNARILVNGDVFDSIWPGDKRFTLSCIRKELRQSDDIFHAICDYGVKVLEPYAPWIDFIGHGNH